MSDQDQELTCPCAETAGWRIWGRRRGRRTPRRSGRGLRSPTASGLTSGQEHEIAEVDGATWRYGDMASVHVVSKNPRDPCVEIVHPRPDIADGEAAAGIGRRPELVALHTVVHITASENQDV